MKDSPIYFTDEKYERLETELAEIKALLYKVLQAVGNQTAPEEAVLNAREVALMIAVDVGTVYSKCSKGEIPHFKIGKQYKFRKIEIEEWVQKGKADSIIDVDDYVDKYLQKNRIKG